MSNEVQGLWSFDRIPPTQRCHQRMAMRGPGVLAIAQQTNAFP